MKIGLFVTSLAPEGASQARFQEAVFAGLARHNVHHHEFVLLANAIPDNYQGNPAWKHVRVSHKTPELPRWEYVKRYLGRLGHKGCRFLGWRAGRIPAIFSRWRQWTAVEPEYYQQLKDLGIDLIWFVNGHELPSWLPYIATVWDANHRIHSMYPEFSYTRCTFAGLDHPLRYVRASYVITGTEEGKRQIAAMYGVYEPKIRVIPFPTPVLPDADGQSAPSFHFPNNAPYVFYPARFWPHKNHVVAVAALKALREKFNCTVNLVFTGADEGNWGYVLEFAQSLGVDEQIAYLGKVSDAELVALYKGAFALVFVAAVGPDNLPPLEAMSLGCPAIVADVPGAREQLADACLYFPPMDERALAQQLLSLIREPSLRASLVAKGLARAQRWTVDDYAAAVMAIFDEFSLIRRAWGPHDASFT